MGNSCGAASVGDGNRYAAGRNDGPSPLTKSQIQARIVCSENAEKMEVECKDCKFTIVHAHLSQRGYYPHDLNKANQDAFCSHPLYNGEKNVGLWGVFDGHGSVGDHVSTFAKIGIPKHLKAILKKDGPASGKIKDATEEDIMTSTHKAFVETNRECGKQNFDRCGERSESRKRRAKRVAETVAQRHIDGTSLQGQTHIMNYIY
jgi:hypothetical protein